MTFPGRFAEQLLPDQLAPPLGVVPGRRPRDPPRRHRRQHLLRARPARAARRSWSARSGTTSPSTATWLDRARRRHQRGAGVTTRHTARFVCTTDADQNQIASFYSGAMSEAARHRPRRARRARPRADQPERPRRDAGATPTTAARTASAFAADPSQQLAFLDGDAIRSAARRRRPAVRQRLRGGAAGEQDRLDRRRGARHRSATRVTTHGADGHRDRAGAASRRSRSASCPAATIVDPTGVGDAFRAGFLAGQSWGLSLERSAQLGALLATLLRRDGRARRSTSWSRRAPDPPRAAYGEAAASEICAQL